MTLTVPLAPYPPTIGLMTFEQHRLNVAAAAERLERARGRLIILDGPDGCGKGSMIKVLRAASVDGIRWPSTPPQIHWTKHPGGTSFGEAMRDVMFKTIGTNGIAPAALELLFVADHIQKCEKTVNPALRAGEWVISDRWFTTSNLAYSRIRKVDPTASNFLYHHFYGTPPDDLFLFYGDTTAMLERAQRRTIETHQAHKVWNTPEAARDIQARFLREFGERENTHLIPATQGGTPFSLFRTYVAPVLHSKYGLAFDHRAILDQLTLNYPAEAGYLY